MAELSRYIFAIDVKYCGWLAVANQQWALVISWKHHTWLTSKLDFVISWNRGSRHNRSDPVTINGCLPGEGTFHVPRLLGPKLTTETITEDAGKMVASLDRFSKYLTSRAILYTSIRPKVDYCCHIWATQSSHSSLVWVQKRTCGWQIIFLPAPSLSQTRCSKPSIHLLLLQGKWSNELHSLVPVILTLAALPQVKL